MWLFVRRSIEMRAKTWHESTNFSSCANFSFSFRFYSTSIERDYNTQCVRATCQSQYVMGAIMYPHTSCYLYFFPLFSMVSTDFLATKPLQWPQVMLLHFVRHEFTLISYILNMFVGINYANLFKPTKCKNMKWPNINAKNPASLLCMVFQSRIIFISFSFTIKSNDSFSFCVCGLCHRGSTNNCSTEEKRKKNRTLAAFFRIYRQQYQSTDITIDCVL